MQIYNRLTIMQNALTENVDFLNFSTERQKTKKTRFFVSCLFLFYGLQKSIIKFTLDLNLCIGVILFLYYHKKRFLLFLVYLSSDML